ncbi:MAG: response regulator [Candidatus Hodarchaeales archaeon]
MLSRILVVDDSPDILYNLELTLMLNEYEVVTASDAGEALNILESADLPDLIISDIMMPEMDGYEFYKKVSANPLWNHIPFIFLTAKASSDDIRFGKMLGVDDYITKPFDDEDLLATVAGKLKRYSKSISLTKTVNDKLTELGVTSFQTTSLVNKDLISVLWSSWDEIYGPKIMDYHPKESNLPYNLETINTQLFNGTVLIYGSDEEQSDSQGILLSIKNINMDGYVFFDAMTAENVRGGKQQFMLAVLAPEINYLQSVMIRKEFEQISKKIKNGSVLEMKDVWENVTDIILKPTL